MQAKYYNVCAPATVYGLLVFLLYASEEDIVHTKFLTSHTIPKFVRDRVPNNEYVEARLTRKRALWYFVKYKILRRFLAPELVHSKIYAQDHLTTSPYIISQRHYTLLPDGPFFLELNSKQKWVLDAWHKKENLGGLERFFSNAISLSRFGYMGKNLLCDHLILTEEEDIQHTIGISRTIVNIKESWGKSSDQKKESILNIFGVTNDLVKILASKKIILFSSPFVDDGVITEEEQISIYQDALKNYNEGDVVIKMHPRDTLDYKNHFPNILVFDKPIPSQLFNLIGPQYTCAITIYSTAVLDFDYDLKVDWIGTKVHPKLYAAFGDQRYEDYISKRAKK